MLVAKIYHILHKLKVSIYPNWNRIKFKIKGVAFGEKLNVYTKVFLGIGEKSKIEIGNNFTFSSGDCINPLCRNISGCIVANPGASIYI